jgi:hypothetical protein
MVLVVLFLIGMAVTDYISDKQREKTLAERDAKQLKYNNLVKGLSYKLGGGRRGFIKCEYAFGRFYIHYECLTDSGEHYSITESFYDTGIQREKYPRVGTQFRFHNGTDMDVYCEMKADMLSIINNLNK